MVALVFIHLTFEKVSVSDISKMARLGSSKILNDLMFRFQCIYPIF